MKEKLRLAKEFGELRAGDLVVIRPCGHCGATHRGMLVAFTADVVAIDARGHISDGPLWHFLPEVRHATGRRMNVGEVTVSRREVYKVDTGLELSQEQTTSRPLEDAR